MFNTLVALKRLEEAGIPRNQAEAQVQMLAEVVEGELARKHDMKQLELGIQKLEFGMKELEHRVVVKLSIIMGTMLTILGSVSAYFN